MNSFHQSYSW